MYGVHMLLLWRNMIWQDLILGIGSILFIIALIPTYIGNNKPAYETALLTTAVLYSFAATYTTLDLWFAATTAAITGIMWMKIAIQAYKIQKEEIDWYE